jgi:hypothetical protein
MNEEQIIAAQEALITQLQEEVRRKDAEISTLRAQVARPQPSWPWPAAPPIPWNTPIQPISPPVKPWDYPGTLPVWCGGYPTTTSIADATPPCDRTTETSSPCG